MGFKLSDIVNIINSITTWCNQTLQPKGNYLTQETAKSDGTSLSSIKFGIDGEGNYGYYKTGADTVTPFLTETDFDGTIELLQTYSFSGNISFTIPDEYVGLIVSFYLVGSASSGANMPSSYILQKGNTTSDITNYIITFMNRFLYNSRSSTGANVNIRVIGIGNNLLKVIRKFTGSTTLLNITFGTGGDTRTFLCEIYGIKS